jgi:uncharacterized repeat protein (TIGR02543 family)
MASGNITGSTVNDRWYAYADWSTSESNTAVALTVEPWVGVNGYNCSYNGVTGGASIDFSVNSSGTVSINKSYTDGLTWYAFPEASKSWDRTKSSQTIYFSSSATFPAGSSNWSGTSTAYGTLVIDPLPSYTVSYNANGGSGAPGNQTKWYGESLTLSSAKPTRDGHIFKGWATSSDGSVSYSPGWKYNGNDALTLYAVWQAVTYTVSYDANGGSGAPDNQTKTWGVNLTLSSTKPTRTNYNFKGWGVSSNSTSVAYAPGATYSSNAGITLYAVWELAWVAPRITNLDATRCDSAGNFTDEGTYAKVTFSWATDKAISSIKIVCNSVTYTPSGTGTSGSVSMVIGNGGLSAESSYTVSVTVADSVGNSVSSTAISPMHFIMDFAPNGSVSFGEPADDSTPKFQISKNLPAYFKSSIRGFHAEGNFSSTKYKILAKGQKTFSDNGSVGHARIFGSIGGWTQSSCGPIDIYVPFRENEAYNLLVTVTELSDKAVAGAGSAKILVVIGSDNIVYVILACGEYYTYNLLIEGIQIDIVDGEWTDSLTISGTTKFSTDNPTNGNIDGIPVKAIYSNGHYGLNFPASSAQNTTWIRTPADGILPEHSDASNGASSLGSQSWPFNSAYVNNLNIWDIYFRKMPGGNIFQELWSGSWASGEITVPGASLYNVFAFFSEGNNPVMIGCRTRRNGSIINAIGGGWWGSVWVNTAHINIYSSDKMSMYHCNSTPLNNGSDQWDGMTIKHIIGII